MVIKVAVLLSYVVLAVADVSSHVSFNGKGHSSHRPHGGHATHHKHAPVHHAPVHHAPKHHAPRHHTPVHHTPVHHAPKHHAPKHHAPVHHAPKHHAPAPSYHAPAPSYKAPAPSYHKPTYEEKAHPYDYAYAVKDDYTGNDFGHQETSNGDGSVYGSYRVLLPDGRTQVVTYTADHYNGYQAEVTYEGEAHYAPAPSYHAPAPSYH
ncbi:unnamed protein product [Meganyctiphanes norvegica]|uniref:Cuticle protein n=1 Tax=Meganyctiphanes norvegica TaxID=48144 RepID=A0AAV2QU80_MEGNR